MKRQHGLRFAPFALMLLFAACGKGGGETPAPPGPGTTPAEVLPLEATYASIRANILVAHNCLKCHGIGGKTYDKVPLETREQLLDPNRDWVIAGKPEESAIIIALTRPDDKRMPLNQPPVPQEEIDVLAKWIEEGAKN